MMKLTWHLCILSSLLVQSEGRPSFVALIPNGDKVMGVAALGHVNPAGGGVTNSFGKAFSNAGHEWIKELCEEDSDGDGATNGQELGDPCCTWTPSTGSSISSLPTHPGVPNSFTSEQLAAMTCSDEADQNFVASSDTSSSTSAIPSAISEGISNSGSLDDIIVTEFQPRISSEPKVDQTSSPLATSEAINLEASLVVMYCFSFTTLAFMM